MSKEQIIWGANHFGIASDNFIVWKKLTISESFTMGMCEYASVSIKGNPKLFECAPQDTTRFHPTQKPVKLYRWILNLFAQPGFKIIDTHGGSFTHAIACEQMGYDLVITEIDKDYYDAAVKRFNLVTSQKTLF